MEQIIREADDKIESAGGDIPGSGMEGTVRVPAHIAITTAPSDISSIHGNEEERDCSTPNSCSSSGSRKKVTPNSSVSEKEGEPSSPFYTEISIEI